MSGSRNEKWLIMVLFATLSDELLRCVTIDSIENEFLEVPIRLNIISTLNGESFFLSIPKKERVKLSLSLGYEENTLTHEYL